MSDLFHEGVPDEYIGKVFLNMAMADQHTFQVLTKRPERMAAWMKGFGARLGVPLSGLGLSWPLPNVWLGTSVENQYWVDQRLPHLAEVPAAVRFLSVEPLLKPVNLYSWLTGHPREFDPPETWPEGLRGSAVGWVIVGGESGPRHRPMEEEWVRDVRDQCQAAEVPFFFKQWGGPRPGGEALLDGRPWREWPEPILAGRYGSEDKP
jgi:protein gp37